MKNVLIVENNIIEILKLINYVVEDNPSIRIASISTSGNDALKILKRQSIDIIVLSSNIIDITIKDLISHISNLKKYTNSVIFLSNNLEDDIRNKNCIFECINKPYDIKEVSRSIKRMLNSNSKSNINIVLKKINTELIHLKFNFMHNGTRYLSEVILEAYKMEDSCGYNLNKEIYPIIAKKYNKKVNNIRCNIIQATKVMFSVSSKEVIKEYFKYSYEIKPTVKEIVFAVLNKI